MNLISLARSLAAVSPSRIREIADVAFSMDGVLKLHFGESNIATPEFIKQAAVRALEEGYTFYTENAGLPGLRRAIAEKYQELHGVRLDPQTEILITASGVQALNVTIRCAIDPGDEAIVLTPNWPNATAIIPLYAGSARGAPRLERPALHLDLSAIEAALTARRTRLIVAHRPPTPSAGWRVPRTAHPSGFLPPPWDLAFSRRGLRAHLFFEPVAPSILRLCGRNNAVIVVQSFSKHCMTGWRLGWVTARQDVVRKAARLNGVHRSQRPPWSAGGRNGVAGRKHLCEAWSRMYRRVRFCCEALQGMRGVTVAPAGAPSSLSAHRGLGDSFDFAFLLRNPRGRRTRLGLRQRRRGPSASAAQRMSRYWSRRWKDWQIFSEADCSRAE
jgi:aspartate/methionine/tyrosine aminotransferase